MRVPDFIGPDSRVCNCHQSHCHYSRRVFRSRLWPEGQRHRPTCWAQHPNTEVREKAHASSFVAVCYPYHRVTFFPPMSRRFKGTLWMSEEHPLSLVEQVTPIIDLMARTSSHFARLRDFVTLKFPPGFPVKIGTNIRIKHLKIAPGMLLLSLKAVFTPDLLCFAVLQRFPCSTC